MGLVLANCVMFTLELCGVKLFSKVLQIPKEFLLPFILVLCVVGSYPMRYSFFDVGTMIVSGLIGYLFSALRSRYLPWSWA